jgi:hypothetical protein
LTLKVAAWLSPVVPGIRRMKVPGRIGMKLIAASPSASNSIESTPSGRISISLMTIS